MGRDPEEIARDADNKLTASASDAGTHPKVEEIKLSEILSQAEIEALLGSLSEGEAEGAPSSSATPNPAAPTNPAPVQAFTSFSNSKQGPSRTAVAYEVYDFRRPDKFSKEQLRTLQMLHETFGRLAGTTLSAYLRSNVNIDLISLEQVPYEEYLRSINQSVFTVMSIPPLSGQAALELEFGLIFTMIDKLLGGPGRSLNRSMLTEIEQPLVRQIIERMFLSLKTAWEGVVIVTPGIETIETSAQFVQIAPPTDIVVSILFEVRIGDARGAMSLCIPYMVLKPITTKLSAQKWFAATSSRRQTSSNRRSLVSQIQDTHVDCWIRLGQSKVCIKDFLALRSGDVIRLDQKTDRDLTLLVANTPKYEGRPALNGKKIAFNVTQALEQ